MKVEVVAAIVGGACTIAGAVIGTFQEEIWKHPSIRCFQKERVPPGFMGLHMGYAGSGSTAANSRHGEYNQRAWKPRERPWFNPRFWRLGHRRKS